MPKVARLEGQLWSGQGNFSGPAKFKAEVGACRGGAWADMSLAWGSQNHRVGGDLTSQILQEQLETRPSGTGHSSGTFRRGTCALELPPSAQDPEQPHTWRTGQRNDALGTVGWQAAPCAVAGCVGGSETPGCL